VHYRVVEVDAFRRGEEMLNFDPRKPFYRTLFLVIGAAIIGIGIAPLRHGDLSYENWWGGLGFAPFTIIFGIIIVLGAIFKPTIFGRQSSKTK
jgi:hypothetical protein